MKEMKPRITNRPRLRIRTKMAMISTGALSIMVALALLSYFQISNVNNVRAAVSGDYRTKASGDWSSTSTWEKYNGTAWVAATSTPASSDGTIEVAPGTTLSVTENVTADQIIIDAGANVTITSSRYIYTANGAGTDLQIDGTLTINEGGYLTQNNSSSVVVNG